MQHYLDIPLSCRLRVYLYGPLEVWKRDASDTWKLVGKDAWGKGRPARSVFKRLLVAPGRRLSRGAIQDDLWPESENFELADKNVYNAVNHIRRVTGKTLVRTLETIYEIANQSVVWVDRDACDALLKEAENRGYTSLQALPLLEQALVYLERGELLEGEGGTWVYGLRKKSEDLLRQCRLWLAENYEQQGKLWQAGEQYRALCQTIPPDERALQRWMAMLYQQGNIQDALKCYRDTKAFAETQEWPLSPALDGLVARLEEQQASASRIVEFFVFPETAVSLWRPDAASPETATRFTAWGALLQAQQDVQQAGAGDILEVDILAMTLRWKRSSGPIAILQQLTFETMRKHTTMHIDHSDHDTGLTRRRALQAIALFPIQMYGLTRFAEDLSPRLPLEELLACCASGMVACWELRQYEPEGLVLIERLLPAYLSTLEKLARHSSPFQAEAACLAAQGYLLIAELVAHARRLEQMEAACVLARSYGQLAQNPNLEMAALIQLAVRFDLEGERRLVEAFTTYQQASALPGFATASPLLQGYVYAALAGTGAFLHHSEALSLLSQAKDVYPTEPEFDPSFAFILWGKGILSFWEGLTLKRTRNYAKALTAFSRFGSLTPVAGLLETLRAEHLVYAASVAVEQRELDTVCLYLDAAEEVAQHIQSKQRQVEVRDTFREVQLLWPREPKVKMLQEKLYDRQS
ncbi:MAG: hypothetical protein JO202_07370 [Ktedonobacteraceae bacterium]|nr:hypothetical protein [Ktedonobacteraceae bacterium]